MNIKFNFLSEENAEIGMAIEHDDENDNVCDIGLSFQSESEECMAICFTVEYLTQLDDIISALKFIRDRKMEDIERKTPQEI